ncbi:unnamed protein product [Gulo gulo]|uniref:Uncharacterized protein n=1 Tax=Gulo gulo TaxID=48420 RepID=A0A9X9PVE5_GULGU|nr:unnamed protein product [Gulo gulo]
MITSAYYT